MDSPSELDLAELDERVRIMQARNVRDAIAQRLKESPVPELLPPHIMVLLVRIEHG
jgi:hypothetical protein